MKKITLLAVAFLFAVTASFAQETSFESNEGYQLGNIDGQNGWQTSSSFSEVSDAMASDGDWSLEIGEDTQGEIDDGYISGPLMQFTQAYSSSQYTYTVDVYVPSDGTELDIILGDVVGNALSGIGHIAIFDAGQGVAANAIDNNAIAGSEALIANDWNTLTYKFDFDNSTIEYLANGTQIYSGNLSANAQLVVAAFFTAGDGTYYVDNITMVEEGMGVEDFDVANFTHYTQNNNLYVSSENQIDNVAIYNLLGQEVANETINSNNGTIDLANMASGVYVAKVAVNGQTKTFKFVK